MKKAAVCLMIMMFITTAVFFCPSVFAATTSVTWGTRVSDVYVDSNIKCYVCAVSMAPPSQSGYAYTTQSDKTSWKLLVSLALTNLTSSTRYIPNGALTLDIILNSASLSSTEYDFNTPLSIQNFGDFYLTNYLNNGKFDFYPSVDFGYRENICIPANSTLTCIAVIEFLAIDFQSGADLYCATLNSVDINCTGSNSTDYCPPGSHQDLLISLEALRNYLIGNNGIPLIDSDLDELNQTVHDLYDLINDNFGSASYNDTIDDSNDLQTTEDQVHQQEQQWYADNKTAIEATGLGNYQYSSGLIDSFGVARYHIALLWNALGDWTYVYYLVFMLGIAVYILRHEPTMRVKQMRADREARMQENQIYTNASRNVRMSRDADYARHVSWGFRSRRK